MHKNPTINIFDDQRFLSSLGPRILRVAGVVGIVGVALAFILGFVQREEGGLAHFLHAYLVSYCFILSIALGALFFIITQHLVRAGWSTSVRRLAELMAGTLPIMLILFLPVLLSVLTGSGLLYLWDNEQMVQDNAHSHLIMEKAAYLNPTFFGIRAVGYFAIWGLLSWYFLSRSVEQDETGNPQLSSKMQGFSAPAVLLFALSVTFAAFDWIMSMLPTWYSTIFGVYFFAGCAWSFFATIALLGMTLQKSGRLKNAISIDIYHDLGKFLFGFTVFWAYIAFSQFMLIWYANIPEETEWYIIRQQGAWGWVAVILIFGHFFIPFFGLMSRTVKRNKPLLAFWCVFVLVMHWIDLYWLIMPNYTHRFLESETVTGFGLIDISCAIGLIGLGIASFAWVASGRSLVAVRDPRLPEALAFKNF